MEKRHNQKEKEQKQKQKKQKQNNKKKTEEGDMSRVKHSLGDGPLVVFSDILLSRHTTKKQNRGDPRLPLALRRVGLLRPVRPKAFFSFLVSH